MTMNKTRLLTDLSNVKQGCIERNESYDNVDHAIAKVSVSLNEQGAIQVLVDYGLSYFASSIVEGNYKEVDTNNGQDQDIS